MFLGAQRQLYDKEDGEYLQKNIDKYDEVV